MEQKNKKPGYFTFIILPHAGGRGPLTLKMKSLWVYAGVGVLIFSVFLTISSVVFSLSISRRLVHYKLTLNDNTQKKEQIDNFSKEAAELNSSIKDLFTKDEELRKLLGIQKQKKGFFSSTGKKMEPLVIPTNNKSSLDLSKLKEALQERKKSLEELQAKVSDIRARYASTPSIWPTTGQVISTFGYRSYPWREYHTGIDISGWYGMPVKVAANGVVSYAGWQNGYGKVVIVDHGRGISTLYGHNSKLLASVGQRVKKGQLISLVGSTGRSTGPHLHYEVRKFNCAINPVAYLNLDIFSASRAWNE